MHGIESLSITVQFVPNSHNSCRNKSSCGIRMIRLADLPASRLLFLPVCLTTAWHHTWNVKYISCSKRLTKQSSDFPLTEIQVQVTVTLVQQAQHEQSDLQPASQRCHCSKALHCCCHNKSSNVRSEFSWKLHEHFHITGDGHGVPC